MSFTNRNEKGISLFADSDLKNNTLSNNWQMEKYYYRIAY